MRIAGVILAQGDTARAVASRMAMPLPLETFRVINGLGAGDRLEPAAR
jgi:hypothetical protein